MAFPGRSALLLCCLLLVPGCSNYTLVVYNHSTQPVLVRVELPEPGGLKTVGGAAAARLLHPHDEAELPFRSPDAVPVAMVWLGSSEDGRLLHKQALNPGKTRLEVRSGVSGQPPVILNVH